MFALKSFYRWVVAGYCLDQEWSQIGRPENNGSGLLVFVLTRKSCAQDDRSTERSTENTFITGYVVN